MIIFNLCSLRRITFESSQAEPPVRPGGVDVQPDLVHSLGPRGVRQPPAVPAWPARPDRREGEPAGAWRGDLAGQTHHQPGAAGDLARCQSRGRRLADGASHLQPRSLSQPRQQHVLPPHQRTARPPDPPRQAAGQAEEGDSRQAAGGEQVQGEMLQVSFCSFS